jgi:ribulose-bisphosphate carboxylase large chain
MHKYIDLGYKPKKEELVAEYYVQPSGCSVSEAANALAGESSIDTWSSISTLSPKIFNKLRPHIYSINGSIVKIAYPVDLFEPGNMPQILSSIAGNIFGMKCVNKLKLLDIEFPKSLVNSFKGPKHGIQGIRKITKIKERPLVGTIIKPKVGLNEKEHAKLAYESWMGGLDVVKDDENLTSQSFNHFKKRIIETVKLKQKAERETGEKKIYMPNVTAETFEMLKRAKFVESIGNEYLMVDILTTGFSSLQTLREHSGNLVIHAHRAMHGALTRHDHGISMLTLAKISRLIGVDQIHIGAVLGKMTGSANEVKHIGENIEERFIHPSEKNHILAQPWYDKKPVFAVCSGGLQPLLTARLMHIMGNDIIMQFGGGVHAHPNGTRAGARAVRQAVDATMQGISLEDYAKTHLELKLAFKQFS